MVFNRLTQLTPVVAYSETSDLNLSSTSSHGMAAILRDYMSVTMDYLSKKYGKLDSLPEDGIAPPINREEWKYYLNRGPRPDKGPSTVVGPLLTTRWDSSLLSLSGSDLANVFGPGLAVSWHQGTPFNDSCPMGDGGKTVVGCVATAAAQIMKYWNYPREGSGSHSYTWNGDQSCGNTTAGGILSATFSDTYDWTNMLNDYSGGYNSTQAAAVAELCYEVGVAFEMDYGRCGSNATTVFPTYFKYANTTNVLYRSSYTNTQWFNLIRKEFDNYLPRPIQYRIYKSGWGGHSVVCDGYNSNTNMIHINYGWDDTHNAWYTLDNLYCGSGDPCPANDQYMVVGIQPVNRMYVLAKGMSDTTIYYGYPFPTISYYDSIGRTSHPPAVAVFNNKQYIAVKGASNNNIYIRSKDGTAAWTDWSAISGATDASPALVVYNNRLYLFVRGLDGGVYYKHMTTGGTWSSWSTVPGWSTSTSPSAAVVKDTLWLFAKGAGSSTTIYYRGFTCTSGSCSWGTTYSFAGVTNKAPTAITYEPTGNLELYVRGLNGQVYTRKAWNLPSGWSSWYSLGGSTLDAPSVAYRHDDGSFYVTVRGGDNGIWYRLWTGSWGSWQRAPGGTSATPVVTNFYFYD